MHDFLASPFGPVGGLTDRQVADLAEPLVWYACEYGADDTLRWTPEMVATVVAHWYPPTLMGLNWKLRAKLEDVFAGFVRFTHARSGAPPEATADAVAAIEQRATSEQWLPRDSVAMRIRLEDKWERELIDRLGGRAAYRALDDSPLPDVPYDWSVVPDELRAPVADTLEVLDHWATELFDPEVRTIARAVLAAIVTTDRTVLERLDRGDRLAVPILCFLMRRIGGTTRQSRSWLLWMVSTQKNLSAATGVPVSAISRQTKIVADVMERADINWTPLLHSRERWPLVARRRSIEEWRQRRR